ncbi:hypothetical protein H2201_000587 [Coniosporium apollinis]|uniref:Uncharacterized protein n=2 Tax=Coniosporium TaxID=2810619 RepID=A0ABQ9P6I3_9PEZI|nr:hypothetical protein H2199_001144 [Cladosporium sp. JES 115]KAJ9669235.1 hypothetical protein H2201_000587 [Coniosporium apollinis]
MAVTRSKSGAQSKKKETATPTPAAKPRKGAKSTTKAKPAVSEAKPVASKVVKKAKKVPMKAKAAAKATTESTAKTQEAASEKAAVPKGQSPPAPSPKKPTRIQPKPVTMEELDDDERSLVDGIHNAGRKSAETKPWKPVASTLRTRAPYGPYKPERWSETAVSGSPKIAQRSPNKLYGPVSRSFEPTNPFTTKSPTKHWGTPSAPPKTLYEPMSPEFTKRSSTKHQGTLYAPPKNEYSPKRPNY